MRRDRSPRSITSRVAARPRSSGGPRPRAQAAARGARALAFTLTLAGALWGRGGHAEPVEIYVSSRCLSCRSAQRALVASGVAHRVVNVDDTAARQTLSEALDAPVIDPLLPVVRVGDQWLTRDPSLEQIQTARGVGALPTARPWSARVQWFTRGDAVRCDRALAALRGAGVTVEMHDLGLPAVEERLWTVARLLGHHPREGLSVPTVILGDRLIRGCPSIAELADALPSERLWALVDEQHEVAPDVSARLVETLNHARLLPRRYARLAAERGWLPADADLFAQLRVQNTLPPHTLPSDQSPVPSVLVFEVPAGPSVRASIARALERDAALRAALLDPEAQQLAARIALDPILGWRIQIEFHGPAPPNDHPGLRRGQVDRPRRGRTR